MKNRLLLGIALLACVAVVVYASPTIKVTDTKITGDYVEARTASVFAGACHYNGELVTVGRDAVMAWNFTGGSVEGVDLAGVRAVAALTSTSNLIDPVPHKSELIVDSSATQQQVDAVANLLRAKIGGQLGQLVAVRRAPISFSHNSDGYVVSAEGFASMDVLHLTDDSCCRMASDVWYSPLSPLEHRKVGYTQQATYSGKIADPWMRSAENSAFYGTFSF
jgi:hypothetical protein